MKRPIFSILFLSVLAAATAADAQLHQWSQRFGSTYGDYGYSVATAPSGNVLVTGAFSETVDFGGGPLVSAGGRDVFVASYSPAGTCQWSQGFGSTAIDVGNSVATDLAGNVFVTGSFFETVDFGGGSLTGAGSADIFVAKYSPTGTHLWSQRFGSTSTDYGFSVATDASGNVFVTGIFQETVDFGGGPLVSAGVNDIFVAKYDPTGTHLWSQRFGGWSVDLADFGNSVATDASGNVFLTGSVSETVDFGGGELVGAGERDMFVAKYGPTGTHLWSQRFGSTSDDAGSSVATDASGNVFVTGSFSETVDFGGEPLVSAGESDIFLAKYGPSGTHLWSQRFGGASSDLGESVATDPSGNVFVTGIFRETVDFGGGPVGSAGDRDMFLARYSPGGGYLWSQRFGDVATDIGRSVATDAYGNVFLTGYFSETVDFGGGPLQSAGSFDMVLARYAVIPSEPTITSITDIGNDQGRKVKIRFARSANDLAGPSTPILQYEAYRRDDAPPAALATPRNPAGLSGRELLADGWTQVGVVAAHQEATYGIDVPTIGDSTQTLGQYYSVFYIRAATDAPGTFFDSAPDSGYSVDNLAPGVPGGLAYNAGLLSWNESSAGDFDYFTVYGGSTDAFGSATLVDYTASATLDVTSAGYPYYFVTATDFSGNEGAPAKINTLTGVGGTPRSYVLSVSNFPNPFNPRTTVSYTVPSRGNVTIAIYDARGARVATLVDNETRDAGAYRMEWDGRADGGLVVPSGVYFARIEQNGAARSKKLVLLK